jgi:hypothetical protein
MRGASIRRPFSRAHARFTPVPPPPRASSVRGEPAPGGDAADLGGPRARVRACEQLAIGEPGSHRDRPQPALDVEGEAARPAYGFPLRLCVCQASRGHRPCRGPVLQLGIGASPTGGPGSAMSARGKALSRGQDRGQDRARSDDLSDPSDPLNHAVPASHLGTKWARLASKPPAYRPLDCSDPARVRHPVTRLTPSSQVVLRREQRTERALGLRLPPRLDRLPLGVGGGLGLDDVLGRPRPRLRDKPG